MDQIKSLEDSVEAAKMSVILLLNEMKTSDALYQAERDKAGDLLRLLESSLKPQDPNLPGIIKRWIQFFDNVEVVPHHANYFEDDKKGKEMYGKMVGALTELLDAYYKTRKYETEKLLLNPYS